MTQHQAGDLVKVTKEGSANFGLTARVIRETTKGGSYIVNLGSRGIRTYYSADIVAVAK